MSSRFEVVDRLEFVPRPGVADGNMIFESEKDICDYFGRIHGDVVNMIHVPSLYPYIEVYVGKIELGVVQSVKAVVRVDADAAFVYVVTMESGEVFSPEDLSALMVRVGDEYGVGLDDVVLSMYETTGDIHVDGKEVATIEKVRVGD